MVIFNSYVKLPGGVNPDVFHISGSHGSHGSQALETGNIVLERARRLAAKRREAPHGTLGTKRCVGERWPLRASQWWHGCDVHGIGFPGIEAINMGHLLRVGRVQVGIGDVFFYGINHSVASCWSKIRQKQQKVWGYHQNRKHPIVSLVIV